MIIWCFKLQGFSGWSNCLSATENEVLFDGCAKLVRHLVASGQAYYTPMQGDG